MEDNDVITSDEKKEEINLHDVETEEQESPLQDDTSSEKKPEEFEEDLLTPLSQKAHQGLLKLYELIDDGTESVTNVREATIQNEIERQKTDECEQLALKRYIAEKEKQAVEEYNKIDERWDKVNKLNDPLNIHNETIIQRDKCNALLQEKDNVIQYLKTTLKKKDETFLNEIDEQGSEVDLLIDRIEQQINTLKEAYIDQLESLEDIIDEEKKLMIDTNREKWEELIQEEEEVDNTYLQKLFNIVDTHEKAMLFSEKEQNEYKKMMRLKLEKNINDLTVQNDSLKSLCILNVEKTTYNYQLLLKKQQDNKVIKQHCKRYSTRMVTQLSNLQKNIEVSSQEASNTMVLYAMKFDKLYDAISSIDKRHTALARSNAKIYFDLWNFNEKEVQSLVDQILSCDKILHEEILYTHWDPPSKLMLEKPPSYIEAMKLYDDINKIEKRRPREKRKLFLSKTLSERLMRIIFDSLQSSCSFLSGHNKESNSLQITSKDQYLLELENILEVLGVKTEEDSSLMFSYFLPYFICPECAATRPDEKIHDPHKEEDILEDKPTVDIGKEIVHKTEFQLLHDGVTMDHDLSFDKLEGCLDKGHHPQVNPLDVNKALRDFTIELHNSQNKGKDINVDEIFAKPRMTPSQMMVADEVTDYWQAYVKIFSSKKIHLWEIMISSIHRYQKILHKRYNLNLEIKKLQRSNYELKKLLQRYIQSSPKVSLNKKMI